jgi:hypothetical protein
MISLRNAVWQVSDFGLEAVNENGERLRIPRQALLDVDREAFSPYYRCHTGVCGGPLCGPLIVFWISGPRP